MDNNTLNFSNLITEYHPKGWYSGNNGFSTSSQGKGGAYYYFRGYFSLVVDQMLNRCPLYSHCLFKLPQGGGRLRSFICQAGEDHFIKIHIFTVYASMCFCSKVSQNSLSGSFHPLPKNSLKRGFNRAYHLKLGLPLSLRELSTSSTYMAMSTIFSLGM